MALVIAIIPGVPPLLLLPLAVTALAQSVVARAMFYVLVIPTTMPGAFFWRNPGFVEHARTEGLAKMPQVGVAYEHHHPFLLSELLHTVMKTSMGEKIAQMRPARAPGHGTRFGDGA